MVVLAERLFPEHVRFVGGLVLEGESGTLASVSLDAESSRMVTKTGPLPFPRLHRRVAVNLANLVFWF